MISIPDKQLLSRIPKKSNFTVAIQSKYIINTPDGIKVDLADALLIPNSKEYDPSKNLEELKSKLSEYLKEGETLDSFVTFTFPERLLYEQHAMEMRVLYFNQNIQQDELLKEYVDSDNFESKNEALILNDRVNAALKLMRIILFDIDPLDISESKDNPSYLYKISNETTIGEYAINKIEYNLCGYDKVLMCEFEKLPDVGEDDKDGN